MMTHILYYATLQLILQPTTIPAYSLTYGRAQALIGIGQDDRHPDHTGQFDLKKRKNRNN